MGSGYEFGPLLDKLRGRDPFDQNFRSLSVAVDSRAQEKIRLKFPEISVQNSMDRFGPAGRVFEKTGPPFEVDHFSRSDWSEFWLNESRPGIKVLFRFCILPSFVLLRVTFCFIINVSRKRLNSILRARVACSSTRKPRNTLNCI